MKLLRRLILCSLLLLAGALLAFGPRPNEALPKDRVVIEYWEKWSGPEGERMRQLVGEFNDTIGKDKGIYVRFLSISNVDRKTLLATAAGVPPDVAGLWDRQLAQYAAIGAVEPLDDLAREYGIGPDTYKPVYWKGIHYEGRLSALVSAGWVIGLHYNKNAFRQAGLDPEKPPRTVAELDAMSARLDLKDGTGRLIRAGHLPTEPGWYINQAPIWFGGQLFDPKAGRFTLTEPASVRAFAWIQDYSRRLGPQVIEEFQSGQPEGVDVARNPFITGAVVMEQQGPWMANYIRRYRPGPLPGGAAPPDGDGDGLPEIRAIDDWGAAPFPAADPSLEDAAYAGFDVLVIPKGARHKREAFELMAFLSRREQVERLAKAHCKNSPLRKVSADFLNNHPNPHIAVFERLAASPNAHSAPNIPTWPEANEDLHAMVQRIVSMRAENGQTPEAALEQALRETQARVQSTYDRFIEVQRARRTGMAEAGSLNPKPE